MQHSEKIELKRALKLKQITKKFQDPPEYTDIKIDLKQALKLKHVTNKFQNAPKYIVCNSYIETRKDFKSNKTAFFYP